MPEVKVKLTAKPKMKMFFTKLLTVAIALMLCITLLAPVVLADGPSVDPSTNSHVRVYSEQVVSGVETTRDKGTRGLCDTMWWATLIGIHDYYSWTNSEHQSISRAASDHSYACDIDRIGTRGRIWVNDSLKSDTGMQYASNSADKVVFTDPQNSVHCSTDAIAARGNHYFQESGITTWQPQSDDSC